MTDDEKQRTMSDENAEPAITLPDGTRIPLSAWEEDAIYHTMAYDLITGEWSIVSKKTETSGETPLKPLKKG